MLNILILDDNLHYVKWMEDYILSITKNVSIRFTDRYDRAVRSLETIKPDIIVTDICIGTVNHFPELPPQWGGLKFIHYVREIKKWKAEEIKIITYTSETSFELVKLVEQYNANYCCKTWIDSFKDDLRKYIVDLQGTRC